MEYGRKTNDQVKTDQRNPTQEKKFDIEVLIAESM